MATKESDTEKLSIQIDEKSLGKISELEELMTSIGSHNSNQ